MILYNNSLYILGSCSSKTFNYTNNFAEPSANSITWNIFLAKIDLNGKINWINSYGTSNYNSDNDFLVINDSSMVILGTDETTSNSFNPMIIQINPTSGKQNNRIIQNLWN